MMFIDDRNEAPKAGEADRGFESAEEVKKLSHADRAEAAGNDFDALSRAAGWDPDRTEFPKPPNEDLKTEGHTPIEGSRDNEV